MMQTETGFLLSHIKYGDRDAILHFFSLENGYRSGFIKNIFAPKNRSRAYIAPLAELEFHFKDNSKPLLQLAKIESIKMNEILSAKENAIIFFLADFLNHNLRNETSQQKIFREIQKVKQEIPNKNYSAHLIFLIKILQHQGLAPLNMSGSYLNPESGNFEEMISHRLFTDEISELWKMQINCDDYHVKIPSSLKKDFLQSVLVYYQYHYPEFRIPVSLEIVQQIF